MNKLVNTTNALAYEGKVKIKSVKDGKIKDIGTLQELKDRNEEINKMLKMSSFD